LLQPLWPSLCHTLVDGSTLKVTPPLLEGPQEQAGLALGICRGPTGFH
jgi:hypothetical protein